MNNKNLKLKISKLKLIKIYLRSTYDGKSSFSRLISVMIMDEIYNERVCSFDIITLVIKFVEKNARSQKSTYL